MDYPSQLDHSSSEVYSKLLDAEWEQLVSLSKHFSLHKIKSSIQEWSKNQNFDLIFFDAFGPRAQPEMWDLPILEKMYNSLKLNGILVTYCAQGQFRRNLKSLGFKVESLLGPPGKREMTIAIKN
jgi:tRNA U34 5-methylaminomethyl-2-thiouridine-forming methyltransferase MnmC